MEGSPTGIGYPRASASGSSNAPRRLSYASVASGAAHPVRVGALDQMITASSHSSYPLQYTTDTIQPHRTQTYEPTTNMYNAREGSQTSHLPEYSRKYAHVGRLGPNAFFVPSYLKDSRYVARLEAAHAAKSKAQRGLPSTTLAGTASGSNNVQRLAPSHRGMTYDIIESNPPKDEDEITPLPSRWSNKDKYPGLDITNDGLDVRYNGSAGKADIEAAAVRADYPMSPACGIYYFEVEIKQKSKDCAVAVGFSTQKASLERLPGWEAESWAYHGDDGRAFRGEHQGRAYSDTFSVGDVIGCGLNFVTGQAFFTRNGLDLGVAFRELKDVRPFPSVGIKKYSGAVISVNLGQRPFVFDIDGRVEAERALIMRDIKKTKTLSLHPGLDESSLARELVAQFLSHGGYVETAKAFAKQRMQERIATNEAPSSTIQEIELEGTKAIFRQRIRRAILSGDIDDALRLTDDHFPTVLHNSPQIVFRLKCRKWVELISRAADLRRPHAVSAEMTSRRSNNGLPMETSAKGGTGFVLDQQMEIDEEQQPASTTNIKTALLGADDSVAYNQLLAEAVEYGQVLQREYRDESNPEYRKTLADIFSLVAYTEPRESVHGHLLDSDGRLTVAEALNSAILVSLGKSPTAALENTYRQTEALIDVLSQDGGPASFVNLKSEFIV